MGVFAVILFFILAIVIAVLQGESHERKITEQIECRLGNYDKEGWVRFGGLFGPDWRL